MGDMKNGWSFWFHSSRNASWSRDSYNFLTKTKNAEIFWGIFKYLNQSLQQWNFFYYERRCISRLVKP